MKNTYAFYSAVLDYLVLQPSSEEAERKNLVALASTCDGLSWGATDENLALLEQCCNRQSTLEDEDVWADTRERFVIAAFKDLSSLRDPKAMSLFKKIHREVTFEEEENFLWARKVMKRPDGSAVVILHVRDYERFKNQVEDPTGNGDIESGRMIYS